jgi:diadenosine tetraphosphate (Ap4A) HIT family hydrolase
MVERCRAGDQPTSVARLRSGWVIMGDRQVLAGYCLLLPDPVVPHLNALSADARAVFLADMGRVGDALLAVTGALRVNYAIFGNVEPALHAHIFRAAPRSRRSHVPRSLGRSTGMTLPGTRTPRMANSRCASRRNFGRRDPKSRSP